MGVRVEEHHCVARKMAAFFYLSLRCPTKPHPEPVER